jgi:hypothetical protein
MANCRFLQFCLLFHISTGSWNSYLAQAGADSEWERGGQWGGAWSWSWRGGAGSWSWCGGQWGDGAAASWRDDDDTKSSAYTSPPVLVHSRWADARPDYAARLGVMIGPAAAQAEERTEEL